MKHAIAAVLALFAMNAHAQSVGHFCSLMADYALVSRALAMQEGVPRPAAESILGRIYKAQDEDAAAQMRQVRDLAYAERRDAEAFAIELGQRCLRGGGNPAAFLGVGT